MRGCARTRRDLLRHVDGDADVDVAARLEEHMEQCPDCRRQYQRHQQVEEWLVSLPRPELTDRDHARLLAGIHERVVERQATATRAPKRLLVPLAAAAVLLGGISLGWFLRDWGTIAPAKHVAEGVPEQVPNIDPSVEPPVPDPDEILASVEPPTLGQAMVEAQRQLHADVAGRLAELDIAPTPGHTLLEELGTRTSRRNLVKALERHLAHADPVVATTAARVLVELAVAQDLGLSAASVTWSLERALAREDRGAEVFTMMNAADLPDRERMLRHALDQPHLQEMASRAVLASKEPSLAPLRATTLRRLWRSEDPGLRLQCQELLATLAPVGAEDLPVLVELYQEGLPREVLAQVLPELTEAAHDLLSSWLRDRKQERRSSARALASLAGHPSFAPVLGEQVRRVQDPVAGLDALVDLGGAAALQELWNLRQASSLSVSLRSLVRDATVRLLQDSPEPLALLWDLHEQEVGVPAQDLVALAAEVPGVRGSDLLLSLASLPALPATARADAGLRLSLRAVPDSPERDALRDQLVAWLPAPDLLDQDPSSAASLLVSLYLLDEGDGVRQGLAALGIPDSRRRQDSILRLTAAAARQAPTGRQGDLVARLADLLHAGP